MQRIVLYFPKRKDNEGSAFWNLVNFNTNVAFSKIKKKRRKGNAKCR